MTICLLSKHAYEVKSRRQGGNGAESDPLNPGAMLLNWTRPYKETLGPHLVTFRILFCFDLITYIYVPTNVTRLAPDKQWRRRGDNTTRPQPQWTLFPFQDQHVSYVQRP